MKKAVVIILATLSLFACGKHPATKNAQSELESLLGRVDSSMQTAHDRLQKIAVSKPALQTDLPTLFIYMREVRPVYVGVDFFADPNGVAVTQNNVEGDLTLCPFWSDLMDGKEIFGEAYLEPFTGKPAAFICIPIFKDNEIIGYVGRAIYLEGLRQRFVDEVPMARGHEFLILDRKGRMLLDSGKLTLIFNDPLERDTESVQAAIKQMTASEKGKTTYTWDNITSELEYRQSALLGWRVAVSYPVGQK